MREDILGPLRAELLTRSALDSLPEGVWKRTGALNTWGTNAIEGNTLSRTDVERILLEQKSVGNRHLSDVLETIQHAAARSEEHTSELQSHHDLVCRLLLEKK